MRFENGNWIFLAVTAAVLLAGVAVFPPCPVWITDNGSKYIIMRNFERSGSVALRHALPDCAPEGGFHIQRHKGELRSFYPEYYPVLCSLFYSEKSERAAAVPAVFGTLLCAYIMLKWFRSRYLAFLLVAGTALLFYTFTLWEMTLSCALLFLSLYLALEKRLFFVSGVILGLSLLMREEAYFTCGCFVFALLFFREYRNAFRFGCGAVCGILPVWIWQYIEFGSIFGLHGKIYLAGSGSQSAAGVLWNYFHHLLRGEPTGVRFEKFFTIVPALLLVVAGFFRRTPLKRISVAAASAGATVILFRYIRCNGFSYAAACSTGVFAAVPLSWSFFADWRNAASRGGKIYRIMAVFVLCYILTVPAVLTRGDVGLIWSARHFMVLLPFFIVLGAKAVKNFQLSGVWKHLPHAVALIAVCQQLCGVFSFYTVAKECAELEESIKSMNTKVVASDLFYLPEMTPRLWFERSVVDISHPEKVAKLLAASPQDMLLVLSADPRFRRIDNKNMRQIMSKYAVTSAPVRFKKERGTGFIDLYIFKLKRSAK